MVYVFLVEKTDMVSHSAIIYPTCWMRWLELYMR